MKLKQMSLRQLANELGVSAAYLTQVRLGKRPPLKDLKEKPFRFRDNIKQSDLKPIQNALHSAKILADFTFGEVSELADEHDLGSCAERCRGSSPLFPTSIVYYGRNYSKRS